MMLTEIHFISKLTDLFQGQQLTTLLTDQHTHQATEELQTGQQKHLFFLIILILFLVQACHL